MLSFKLNNGFYFSYDFDLTASLADNLVSPRELLTLSNSEKKVMNFKTGTKNKIIIGTPSSESQSYGDRTISQIQTGNIENGEF